MTKDRPAVLVGFAAEADIARGLGWPVGIGGGSTEGAAREARRLIEAGAAGLISFGLAGGLDRSLPAGTLIVADAVAAHGRQWCTDVVLSMRLGGVPRGARICVPERDSAGTSGGTRLLCLGMDRIVASSAEKQRLWRETGAAAVDMESGAVAAAASEAGVPFAVVRAICDPASLSLPPAALVALDASGRIAPGRLVRSILSRPAQLGALLVLARGATAARRALRSRVADVRRTEDMSREE